MTTGRKTRYSGTAIVHFQLFFFSPFLPLLDVCRQLLRNLPWLSRSRFVFSKTNSDRISPEADFRLKPEYIRRVRRFRFRLKRNRVTTEETINPQALCLTRNVAYEERDIYSESRAWSFLAGGTDASLFFGTFNKAAFEACSTFPCNILEKDLQPNDVFHYKRWALVDRVVLDRRLGTEQYDRWAFAVR